MVICNGLEKKGLIERRRHPSDRRAYQLVLTPSGRDRLQQAHRAMEELYRPVADAINEQEASFAIALLSRLAEKICNAQSLL